MTRFDGSSPDGLGTMTGRNRGPSGAEKMSGQGCGRGFGFGPGLGMGHGAGPGRGNGLGMNRGPGRGCGWFEVGHGLEGDQPLAANVQSALERRKAMLLAELERTEALLSKNTD